MVVWLLGCRETVRLLNRLYQWDVMRANKVPFAWGVEARVPFLDKAFLDLVMSIDPAEKMVRAFRQHYGGPSLEPSSASWPSYSFLSFLEDIPTVGYASCTYASVG